MLKTSNSEFRNLLSRRNFLIQSGTVLGWAVAPKLVKVATHLALEHQRILDLGMHNPDTVIYASQQWNILTLNGSGDPQFPELTWSDWVELEGYDPDNPKSVLECFVDYQGLECECERRGCRGQCALPNMSDPVSDSILWSYFESEWTLRDSPEARAKSLLEDIDFGQHELSGGIALGGIIFDDGSCPGSNVNLVRFENLESLSVLQSRLVELGHDIKIELID